MNRSCFLPLTLLLAIFLLNSTANAQNTGSLTLGKDLSLTVGGFLRTDFLMDSRQTSEAAEGLFTFYPLAPSYDAAVKDINANGKVGYAALASRLTTRFFGPQFIGAATQAYIEFDFTSVLSGTSGVRLRQAYMQLDWEKTRLLVGQAWHPLSSNLTPTVIGLNTGAPFWAFNRSPQLRLEHRAGNFLFTLAHVYQADYASPGPLAAVKSSEYQRNTLLPEMTLSVRYGKNFQIGLAGETKTIQPRNFTTGAGNLKYKTSTKLTTFSGQGWISYTRDKFQLKAESLYGQNMYESFMFGGYGIHATDPTTGRERYTPTQHLSNWINITYGKRWRAGLFAGYIRNLGTTRTVPAGASGFFGREPGMKQMTRFAPHILHTLNQFQFGAEAEISTAWFGEVVPGTRGTITNEHAVTNARFQLTLSFNF